MMRKHTQPWTMLLINVVLCTGAMAVGDPHTQGTLLAGQGLDWQRSGTALQRSGEVQPPGPTDPIPYPPPAQSFKVGRAELRFSTNCQQVSDLVMRCEVAARATITQPDTQLCGHWLAEGPKIWVYVLKGRPEPSGGFTFGLGGREKEGAFVACSVTDSKDPSPWEWSSLGAVGKCLLWPRPKDAAGKEVVGWIPTSTSNQREFNACVRAVRADYCGNGVTHTVDGTPIELYGIHESHTGTLPYVLEATWNDLGAVCLLHARWLSLSPTCRTQFSRILGSPKSGKQEGKEKGGGSGSAPRRPYTGTEYHCDPARLEVKDTDGSCAAEPGFVVKALLSGLLADDSLLH